MSDDMLGDPSQEASTDGTFTFEDMTPALQAYLDALSASTSSADRERINALRDAAGPVVRRYWDAYTRWVCRDEAPSTPCGTPETCGRYQLVVSSYASRPGHWGMTRGIVTDTSTGKVVADVARNYACFEHFWMTGHPDGHDYLVTGSDYQGLTVCRLDTGERVDWLPRAAAEGLGWCMVDGYPAPGQQTVALAGCYWAAPFEMLFFDTSTPMNLPWPQLGEADIGRITWESSAQCRIEPKTYWARPEKLDAARTFAHRVVDWVSGLDARGELRLDGRPRLDAMAHDHLEQLARMLDWLEESDRKTLAAELGADGARLLAYLVEAGPSTTMTMTTAKEGE